MRTSPAAAPASQPAPAHPPISSAVDAVVAGAGTSACESALHVYRLATAGRWSFRVWDAVSALLDAALASIPWDDDSDAINRLIGRLNRARLDSGQRALDACPRPVTSRCMEPCEVDFRLGGRPEVHRYGKEFA